MPTLLVTDILPAIWDWGQVPLFKSCMLWVMDILVDVGIGTTKPAYRLHVVTTGTGVYATTSGSSAIYGNSTNSKGYGVWGNSTYAGVYGTGAFYGNYG